MKQEEFVEMIAPIIAEISHKRNYHYPSAIIAQACLESGYGKSKLASKYNNYFGMKCGSKWTGKSVNLKTKEEYSKGTLTEIKDNFRVYDTIEDGINGYFNFINTKRYENLKRATSCRDYLEKIKADGYATSYEYVDNLMAVVNRWDLTKYDNDTVVTYDINSLEKIADEVIAGKWGNGAARRVKLKRAGYNYNDVQRIVNQRLFK